MCLTLNAFSTRLTFKCGWMIIKAGFSNRTAYNNNSTVLIHNNYKNVLMRINGMYFITGKKFA